MFVNYANQIYYQLIQQDYFPFIRNMHHPLTDETMLISLMKITPDITYIVNILNAYNYAPDVLIGKTIIERDEFTQRYNVLNIKSINIFLSKNDEPCKNYIDNIKTSTLETLDNIFWSVSIDDNANSSIYHHKKQPSKLMGIEKILKSISASSNNKKSVDIEKITYKAIFESPLLTKFTLFKFYRIIIFINIAIFFMIYASAGINYESLLVYGAFSYDRIVNQHEYYRLFTSMFLHGSFSHLFNNMFTLYIFGRSIETTTSNTNFLATYFLSGLAANTVMLLFPSSTIMVGASGCIFGLIGATLVLTFLFNKSIYGLSFSTVLSIAILNIFISLSVPEISLSVHLLGFIFGALIGYVYALDLKKKFK